MLARLRLLVRFIATGFRLGIEPHLLPNLRFLTSFRVWLECHDHLRLATMAWFKAGPTSASKTKMEQLEFTETFNLPTWHFAEAVALKGSQATANPGPLQPQKQRQTRQGQGSEREAHVDSTKIRETKGNPAKGISKKALTEIPRGTDQPRKGTAKA